MKFVILLLLATSAQAVKLMAGRANHKQLAQVKSVKALKLSQLKHKEGQFSDTQEVDLENMFDDYAQVKSQKALKLSQLKHKQEEDPQPTWAQITEILDTDGDGKISTAEAEAFDNSEEHMAAFETFAVDGLLDEAEFNAAVGLAQISSKSKKLMKLAQIKQDPTWESVTEGMDTNGDNQISKQEAIDAGIGPEQIAHFDQFAVDGLLDEAGFNAAMAALAQVSTKKAVKLSQLKTKAKEITWAELTEDLDVNKDASISIEEIGKAKGLKQEDMDVFVEFAGEDGSLNEEEFNALIASFG